MLLQLEPDGVQARFCMQRQMQWQQLTVQMRREGQKETEEKIEDLRPEEEKKKKSDD